mmetsp:Transcript_19032/g.31980  ORF Transcript_19032/g.31980 Transcript_19032/m.31980 type:complete len:340 (+) Transcript_19032:188-1207(+)|eukprot:CAMPEP_0198200432 /NCGR_PEP_ID=MMETSP1445-20131203/3440_1 /TAXON_ID=36898 /ORGANISM="Pyramimonas sp., Strain CCMP2087" /LENGTH=339 /DNA_ID=CAMNT_0043870497 /DNA_START=226 /DNA_END=1245 /DNA_ORIENTATION=-
MNNNNQLSTRFTQLCDNCQIPTTLVEDHAAGDLICQECGLVLESRTIDESTEWRTFSNSDGNSQDPSRVGGPSNPLLRDGGLSTVIGKGESAGSNATNLARLQNRGSNPDRNLISAFSAIGEMADRLGLVSTIKDRANENYRDIAELKSIRGRSASAIHAACLYIACRQEDRPRTFKEICSVARDTNTREIGRCFNFILKALNEKLQNELNKHTLRPGDLLRRYCSSLGLPNEVIRAVLALVERFLDLRAAKGSSHKSQNSVAAAGIYLITTAISSKQEDMPDLKQISQIAGLAEATIKASYEDMYPHRVQLLKDLPKVFMDLLPPNYDDYLPKPKAEL